jgi:hypothetical protein
MQVGVDGVKSSRDMVAKAVEGDYRPEHLFRGVRPLFFAAMGRDLHEYGIGRHAGITSALRIAGGGCGGDDHCAGIPVDVAVAGDPDSASFAARGFRGITIVPPGQEGAILSPLPLHLLPCSPEVAAILNAWGIRTFGAFAALPPAVGFGAKFVRGRCDLGFPETSDQAASRLSKM